MNQLRTILEGGGKIKHINTFLKSNVNNLMGKQKATAK